MLVNAREKIRTTARFVRVREFAKESRGFSKTSRHSGYKVLLERECRLPVALLNDIANVFNDVTSRSDAPSPCNYFGEIVASTRSKLEMYFIHDEKDSLNFAVETRF